MAVKQRIICLCNHVSTKEILTVLKKNRAYGFEEVKLATGASTSCGRCRIELEAFVEQEKAKGTNPQLTLF